MDPSRTFWIPGSSLGDESFSEARLTQADFVGLEYRSTRDLVYSGTENVSE